MTIKHNGAHYYEISVDGTPRSYRDLKSLAIESAQYLKRQRPYADVAVRNLTTGETIAIKSPTAVQ